MKKIIILVIIMILVGCSNDIPSNNEIKVINSDESYENAQNYLETNQVIYGYDSLEEYNLLYFIDKNSNKKTILCQKMNCKHDSDKCNAYVGQFFSCMMAYQDKILYLDYDGDKWQLLLYSMNFDGSEKKQICAFKYGHMFPNSAGIYQGKLYITCQTTEQDEEGNIIGGGGVPDLFSYDLESGEEELLLEGSKHDNLWYLAAGGNEKGLYLIGIKHNDEAGVRIDLFDIKTHKLSNVAKFKQDYGWNNIDKGNYPIHNEEHSKLIMYNLETKEEKEYFDIDKEESYTHRKGYIELSLYDEAKNAFVVRYYDMD